MKQYLVPGLLLLLNACSTAPIPAPVASVQQHSTARKVPFKVDIVQEVNDGVELEIQGKLHTHFNWDPDSVVVRVTGLQNGVPGFRYAAPLSQLLTDSVDTLKAGENYRFSLVLAGSQISDYQLEILWGAEAEGVPSASRETQAKTSGLILSEIEVLRRMDCSAGPDCKVHHELLGLLENKGSKTAKSVVVGVGYIERPAADLDLSNEIPENETPVVLPGAPLPPGERKTVRVQLEASLSEAQDEKYLPVMRVLEVEPL